MTLPPAHAYVLARLCDTLEARGTPPYRETSGEDIAQFEQKYGIRFPQDVREYFVRVGGMAAGKNGMDDALISLWRLDEVVPQSADESPQGSLKARWFIFGDYSIQAYHYLIRLCEEPQLPVPVAISHSGVVAESLIAFLEGYIRNNDRVLHGTE